MRARYACRQRERDREREDVSSAQSADNAVTVAVGYNAGFANTIDDVSVQAAQKNVKSKVIFRTKPVAGQFLSGLRRLPRAGKAFHLA